MAAWMEDDDASELQDYLQGFHSRSKGEDVDWKTIMEGGSVLVVDRMSAKGLGGRSKPAQVERKGRSRFLKGKSTVAKDKKETKSDLVSSTALPTNEFLKNNAMSPASDCSRHLSSSTSSLLSDDQLSERDKQSLVRVASMAHTSLHSDVSSIEYAKNTQSSIASDHTSPPSTVAVELPCVQFAADLTSSPSSTTMDLVATANSASEQLSTVATEARREAPRSGQDSSQASVEEEGGYDDDTFEDVSVLDDSEVQYRTDSHESNLVEHDYGDSDFEESSVESSSSKDSGEEENEDEDDNVDDDRTSIDDRGSLKEVSHSVVIEQSKSVPSVPPLTKTSSTGVQTDDVAITAITSGVEAPSPPPSLSVLQSLLTMPTIGGAARSLHPPSAAVLDDLLRQHIHLARQSLDFTRAVAGRIEANLNTNHRYTTLQDTRKYLTMCKPLPLCSRGV